jgi:hypothetical protein
VLLEGRDLVAVNEKSDEKEKSIVVAIFGPQRMGSEVLVPD